mmetsp:Transcript_41526/g.66771  ORF Transcript_41526/g.66771 Transcript_41526/m.66771 type:complete len:278 (+) Transcript_41526:25-858(+)
MATMEMSMSEPCFCRPFQSVIEAYADGATYVLKKVSWLFCQPGDDSYSSQLQFQREEDHDHRDDLKEELSQPLVSDSAINVMENDDDKDMCKEKVIPTSQKLLVKLRQQLARGQYYGLPGTDGTFWSVYRERLRQDWIVGSVFTAHPLAKFGRYPRVLWWINSLAVLFCISVALHQSIKGEQRRTIIKRTFITLALTAPNQWIMRFFMECSCCLHNKCAEMIGTCLGGCFMVVWTMYALLLFAVALIVALVLELDTSWVWTGLISQAFNGLVTGIIG